MPAKQRSLLLFVSGEGELLVTRAEQRIYSLSLFCFLSLHKRKQDYGLSSSNNRNLLYNSKVTWRRVEDAGDGTVLLLKSPKDFRLLPDFQTH